MFTSSYSISSYTLFSQFLKLHALTELDLFHFSIILPFNYSLGDFYRDQIFEIKSGNAYCKIKGKLRRNVKYK